MTKTNGEPKKDLNPAELWYRGMLAAHLEIESIVHVAMFGRFCNHAPKCWCVDLYIVPANGQNVEEPQLIPKNNLIHYKPVCLQKLFAPISSLVKITERNSEAAR